MMIKFVDDNGKDDEKQPLLIESFPPVVPDAFAVGSSYQRGTAGRAGSPASQRRWLAPRDVK